MAHKIMAHKIEVQVQLDRLEIESTLKKFLVVGCGYWGKGDTIKEAKKNCIREGCKAKDKMVAFWGSDDISITSAGFISAQNMVEIGEV